MTRSGKAKTMIPKGVATLLPEGTFRRRSIEKTILTAFSQWGYQEVIPPIFEYLDVFSLGVGEEMLDSAYKFIDRATGRIMVLRPDVTPQIARIASTLLKDQPKPLRLCYSANVFRHQEEHAGRERELFQIGGELIGPADAEADAEMISLTIEMLQALGLKDFRITIGQMAFTRGILSRFKSDPVFFKKILHFVAKKEASQLKMLLKEEAVDAKSRAEVLSLLDLFGGESVLKQASDLTNHASCELGLERLKEVYDILKSAGYQDYLLIDLGEVRGFDYYTGTIFEIFAAGVGSELGGGGRYDLLLEKFGEASASTGFGLYIERIQTALDYARFGSSSCLSLDLILLHSLADRKNAMDLARQLRNEGFRVVRKKIENMDCIDPFLPEALAQKVKNVLVMEKKGSQDPFRLINVLTGTVKVLTGAVKVPSQGKVIEWLKSNISGQ